MAFVYKHIRKDTKEVFYIGIGFHRITFKLYSPDGELLLNWD
jgi:hypothetical protein